MKRTIPTRHLGLLAALLSFSGGYLQAAAIRSTGQAAGDEKMIMDLSKLEYLTLEFRGEAQGIWKNPVLIDASGHSLPLASVAGRLQKIGAGPWENPPRIHHPAGAKVEGQKEFRVQNGTLLSVPLHGKFVRFETQVTASARAVFQLSDRSPVWYYQLEQLRRGLSAGNLAAIRKRLEEIQSGGGPRGKLAGELLKPLADVESNLADLTAALKNQPETLEAQIPSLQSLFEDVQRLELDAPLLFVKRHAFFSGHIYDDYFTWHPGGGIYVIENPWDLPARQHIRAVIDPQTPETLGPGVYRDPELSYDAKKLLFSFKGEKEGCTSIYEIGVDGKGLRRLTHAGNTGECRAPVDGTLGKGEHDINPCYLPDGRIVFTSTRTGAHVMCFSSHIDTLHTMNPDGSDIKCISVNNQNEFDPVVMPDGRLVYGRWEYIDKTALYMQSLWTANPDGSGERAVFKNNLAKPTAVLDPRPVPGTDWIVASLTPHNGQSVGAIAMIDPKVGKNSLDAITNFTPEYPTQMDQGLSRGPSDPWPLSKDLVVMANNAEVHGNFAVLETVDRAGFRGVVHREADIGCYSPMLVKVRPTPPVIPSQIRPGEPARFLINDIYQGMDGVQRGDIKKLRVLETTARVSGIPSGGRWWNQAFLVSWQGSYDIKNFLGTVPVESDGSAYFEAPPGKALYFQALDKDGRMVQSQRTFIQATPGTTRSCVGCHIKEDNATPISQTIRPQALSREASPIQAESWGNGWVDYASRIQPVLDRNCLSCHGGSAGIQGGIDLSGGWTWAFNISYETLIKTNAVGFLNCNNGAVQTAEILPPRTHGSGAAPLAKLLLEGHKGRLAQMTPADRELLLAWMDGNANYYGTWNYSETATCKAILDLREELLAGMNAAGCMKCHSAEIGNDWINLQNPKQSRMLRAPMAEGQAMGLAWCRDRKARGPRPLVNQSQQPPDVFHPAQTPALDLSGAAVTSFSDASDAGYQKILAIIERGRTEALKTPRVDMPGARIIVGECRQLPPLSPPAAMSLVH